MVKKAPARSSEEKARTASSIFPSRAHSRTAGLACKATTRMCAPVSSSPAIFGSPTFPAPTTRTCRPSSFKNIGNKLVTDSSYGLRQTTRWQRQIAYHRIDHLSGQKLTQLRVVVSRKETAQILSRFTLRQILTEQPFECVRNIGCRAAVADGPRGGLMQAQRATHAEVVGVHHLTVDLQLLALDADIGNPVLAATVRASRNVQLHVLIEPGQA